MVVGIHNEHILREPMEEATIIPLTAFESILGRLTVYNSLDFTIKTQYNREITSTHNTLEDIITSPRAVGLQHIFLDMLFMDEELRTVVGAMGQVLLLLELMYPMAVALAMIIGAGLSMLLMLQTAKNAAIMRVLGSTGQKTRIILCIEQLVVVLGGLILGLAVMIGFSWGFGPVELLVIAGIYLGGAVIGSVAGAVAVTAKPPLRLLQVRE